MRNFGEDLRPTMSAALRPSPSSQVFLLQQCSTAASNLRPPVVLPMVIQGIPHWLLLYPSRPALGVRSSLYPVRRNLTYTWETSPCSRRRCRRWTLRGVGMTRGLKDIPDGMLGGIHEITSSLIEARW